MNLDIALGLLPDTLSRCKAIGRFGLEASPCDKMAAIGLVVLFTLADTGKNILDIMVALIICSANPDAFGLVKRWKCHSDPRFFGRISFYHPSGEGNPHSNNC
jgi:hypothetical protein